MKLTDRLKKAAGLAVLPAATVLTANVLPITAAHAQSQAPAAFLKVLTPQQNETLGTTQFKLDVQFKSMTAEPIVTAELWVDGVRWVRRDLDSPRRASVLSFLVDGSSLSAGAHNIVVKVFNADGDESNARLSIVAGSDEGENNAAYGGPDVQFVTPGNGKKVSGNVELLVSATSPNGQNPYVTFTVDKKFKTLKNYPPYTFVWDTTTETNGIHEVEASGYLDSSNATTTRLIRVFVDNPGGNTVRMSDIPDLSTTHKRLTTAKAVPTAASTVNRTVVPPVKHTAPAFVAPTGEASLSASVAAPLNVSDSLGLVNGTDASIASTTVAPQIAAPKIPTFSVATVKPVVVAEAVPTAKSVVSVAITRAITPVAVAKAAAAHAAPKVAVHAEPKLMHVASAPIVSGEPTLSVASGVASVDASNTVAGLAGIQFASPSMSVASPQVAVPATPAVVTPVRTVAPATVARAMRTVSATPSAKSSFSLAAPVHAAVTVTTPASISIASPVIIGVPKAIVHMNAHVVAAKASTSVIDHHVSMTEKPIQVAFDGQRIAFDVQPRVEAGLPIAPFRQIFEHTGGRVSWTSATKTVHAVNADREIVIGVGKNEATVNGSLIKMDRAATIEHGRTIVPLNFVGKALDVNVQYDAATGRLSITSKN